MCRKTRGASRSKSNCGNAWRKIGKRAEERSGDNMI